MSEEVEWICNFYENLVSIFEKNKLSYKEKYDIEHEN